MKWPLIFIFSIALLNPSKGQETDSLIELLRNVRTPDTTRVLALVRVAFQISESNPDSSLRLSRQADSLALSIDYEKGSGRARRAMGRHYFIRGDFKKSIQFFQEAIDFCHRARDKRGEANALIDLGSAHKNLGNYTDATESSYMAIKLYEELGKTQDIRQVISVAYVNLGILFKDLNLVDRAFQYLDSAVKIKMEVQDKIGLGRTFSNLGGLYGEQGDYKKSNEYLSKALQISNDLDAKELKIFVLKDLARNDINEFNFKSAKQNLDSATKLSDQIKSDSRLADVENTWSYFYLKQDQFDLALQHSSRAEKLAASVGSPSTLLDALKMTYQAYECLSRSNEALKYYKRWVSVNDSLRNDRGWRQALMREFALKEEKIVLDQEKQELEHEAATAKQKVVTNMVLGLLFTVSLISVLILLSYSRIKKHRNVILESREELSKQRDLLSKKNAELEAAQNLIQQQNQQISQRNEILELEVERRTHELLEYNQQLEQFAFATAHHLRAPVARIVGLGNVLKLSDQPHAEIMNISSKMAESSRELDQVVSELNFIIRKHRNIKTTTSLLSLGEEFAKIRYILRREIKLSSAEIEEDFSRIAHITCVQQYFQSIFFHLLGNAIKFSKPKCNPRINIRSDIDGQYATITVSDNGLGIDLDLFGSKMFNIYSRFHTHVEGRGLGLYLVKSQLSIVGGKIEVCSKVDSGSEFKVYLKV